MFTEMLQAEIWRKRLEAAGFRVLNEAWVPPGDEARRDEHDRASQTSERRVRPP
jgi:hypothetical protein